MLEEKKPNQIIDEITNVIYPPAPAIEGQLNTIRSLAASTLKTYQAAQDIHSILVNLDMMEKAINYLRGQPMLPELEPKPEDTLKPVINSYSEGTTVVIEHPEKNTYEVLITGKEVVPKIHYPDLFGELPIDVATASLTIPVICGNTYSIEQVNPVLQYYSNDPSIYLDETTQEWVKEKDYYAKEDDLEYSFLIQEGRSEIVIKVKDLDNPNLDDETITFNIHTHIHFKEQEEIKPDTETK